MGLSCKFSLKPIHWHSHHLFTSAVCCRELHTLSPLFWLYRYKTMGLPHLISGWLNNCTCFPYPSKSWSNTVHPKTSDIRIMIIRIWPLHDTSDITRTTLGSHWLRGWFPLLPHPLKTIVPCDPALWPLGRLQQHRADQAGVPLAARFLPLPWEVMKQRLLLGETTAKGKYWNKMN